MKCQIVLVFILSSFIQSRTFSQENEPWYVTESLNVICNNWNLLGIGELQNDEIVEFQEIFYLYRDMNERVQRNFKNNIDPKFGITLNKKVSENNEVEGISKTTSETSIIPNIINVDQISDTLEIGAPFLSFMGYMELDELYYVPVSYKNKGSFYSSNFYFLFSKKKEIERIIITVGIE